MSCRSPKIESAPPAGQIAGSLAVGKNEAAKASDFNKEQQLSTNDVQQIQYQSVGNYQFQ